MKQLLRTSPFARCCGPDTTTTNDAVIVGIGDHAFLSRNHHENSCTHLLPDTIVCDGPAGEGDHDTPSPHQVQAVALYGNDADGMLWCAVARHDKSLTLYQLPTVTHNVWPDTVLPTTVHRRTHKRVSCATFAKVDSMLVVIVGDLNGDAVAYPLVLPTLAPSSSLSHSPADDDKTADNDDNDDDPRRHGRVVLGHTASMLTAVRIVQVPTDDDDDPWTSHQRASSSQLIVTADRDEKIRLSCWPNTHIIHGFLLGHTAFVTAVDAAHPFCASVGGDCYLRLWSLQSCQEMDAVDLRAPHTDVGSVLLPVQVVLFNEARTVIVSYDQSTRVDCYHIIHNDNKASLAFAGHICFPAAVLGVQCTNASVLVLAADSHVYEWNGRYDAQPSPTRFTQAVHDAHVVPHLPPSILDYDKHGNLKMEKLQETRGSVQQQQPWNDAKRRTTARLRNKRGKMSRSERQRRRGEEEEKR